MPLSKSIWDRVHDAALHLAGDFLFQHDVQLRFAVGSVHQLAGQRAEVLAGDPGLAAVGVIDFVVRQPAEGVIADLGKWPFGLPAKSGTP